MNRKIIAIIASLVILIAGTCLWRTLQPPSGKYDPEPAIGVGQILAEETAKAVHDHGSVIAIIAPGNQETVGAEPIEWETFSAELKKHPAINLLAAEVPPNADGLPGCSTAAFKEILESRSQADAIVFFMSLPPWSFFQGQGVLPPPPTAKVIVMGGPTFTPKNYYSGYFTNGLLSVLIVGRMKSGPDQIPNPRTPREFFNNEYQIFTPQNYESLPD